MVRRCAIGDIEHEDSPLSYGAPPPWLEPAPEHERTVRVHANADQTIVDEARFFLGGHLDRPGIREHAPCPKSW